MSSPSKANFHSSGMSEEEENQDLQLLTKSIKTLNMKDITSNDTGNGLLAIMSQRLYSLEKERDARKATWKGEILEGVNSRKQFLEWITDMKKSMLLPEVWRIVLGHVKEPKDKVILSNMSLVWNEVMKNEKASFLFHLVFPILHANGHLTRADIQSSRGVSREWRDSIGNHLQNVLNTHVEEAKWSGRSGKDDHVTAPSVFEFFFPGTMREISDFNIWSDQIYAGRNPFFSRKLGVGRASDPWQSEPFFWTQVEGLLNRWGRELWEVRFGFDERIEFMDMYMNLRQYLGMLPNLRSLIIINNELGELDETSVIGRDMKFVKAAGHELYGLLGRTMNLNPLPELPHLKSLFGSFLPPPMFRRMLHKYGPTLESVFIGDFTDFEGKLSDCIDGVSLPSLKRFYHRSLWHTKIKEPSFSVDCPSVEEIGMIYINLGEVTDVPRIFKYVNGLGVGETCRELLLTLHNESGTKPIVKLDPMSLKTLSLALPQVEKMTLSVCRINLKSIDFILPMANLKELSLSYVKFVSSFEKHEGQRLPHQGEGMTDPQKQSTSALSQRPASEEIIQFADFTNRLYESNIWRLFPVLRKVTIRITNKLRVKGHPLLGWNWNVFAFMREVIGSEEVQKRIKLKEYTREGYEQHQKMVDEEMKQAD